MWRSTQVEPGGPKKVGGLAFEDESGRGADKVSSFLDWSSVQRQIAEMQVHQGYILDRIGDLEESTK